MCKAGGTSALNVVGALRAGSRNDNYIMAMRELVGDH